MTRVKGILVVSVLGLLAAGQAPGEEGKEKIALRKCPSAVQKTLRRESADGTIKEIATIGDEAATMYTAGVTVGKHDYQVIIAEDGTLVQKILDDDRDHTEEEIDLDLEDCPLAVQKTLAREAHGFEIELVVERVTNGETAYLADIRHDGVDYLVIVADDGTLISKTLYEDQDELPGESSEAEVIVI